MEINSISTIVLLVASLNLALACACFMYHLKVGKPILAGLNLATVILSILSLINLH